MVPVPEINSRTAIDIGLVIVLAGALYGWASAQASSAAEIRHLRADVDALQQTVGELNTNFQGTRLEIARWMAQHEDILRRR